VTFADSTPAASIVIPTRDRPEYLSEALASIVPQAQACGCEVLVVDDSADQTALAVAERGGARHLPRPRPLGANAARNAGVMHTRGELVVFVDDDVRVCEGWLQALLAAARNHPERDVFAGRILPRLEGGPPRSCGREPPPITSLDLGERDCEARFAWSANMAVRRSALLRAGPFDASLKGQGEEQEWQERLLQLGGERALYVADARLLHRRLPDDATLSALARAAWRRGIEARRFDARRRQAPPLPGELRTLLRCIGHVLRYRCLMGLTMLAHSSGRLAAAIAEHLEARAIRAAGATPQGPRPEQGPEADRRPQLRWEPDRGACQEQLDDFLSGESGAVGGIDRVRRQLHDRATEGLEMLSGRRLRLRLASRRMPRRQVLALGVTRERHESLVDALVAELLSSRHEVSLHTRSPGDLGKFQNLNALLQEHPADEHDWLIVFDDDIELPRDFLDCFLFLAERFALDLAQPAHRRSSHAAWEVTRRQPRSVVRETQFVEIGPLTAFMRDTFETLLPFPPLQMGWGLDAHWGALARQRGWRCGVVDALPIYHRAAPAGQSYSREQTIAEARDFLAQRPHLTVTEAQRTLTVHRRW
jgi:GT2 family glycosyltransferase